MVDASRIRRLLAHVTSYWYNSSWMIGFNVQVTAVLSKWSMLPLSSLVDHATINEYRGMLDLITSAFFGQNDYTVFSDLLRLGINLGCVLIAPLILLNLTTVLPDGSPGLAWKDQFNSISIYATIGVLAMMLLYLLIDNVTPTSYEREVRRWMAMQKEFISQMNNQLIDAPLACHFARKSAADLQKTIESMNKSRDQNFVYLLAIDMNGKCYEWFMVAVYVTAIAFSPLLVGIFGMSVGELQALLGIVKLARTSIAQLSNTFERLRIARFLINELASLLNSDRDAMLLEAEHSHKKLIALRRIISDLDMDHASITLYKIHHMSPLLHDAFGNSLQVNLEGQLPTGVLYGLASPATIMAGGSEVSQERERIHHMIIDLLAGVDTPIEGAVAMAPHLARSADPTRSLRDPTRFLRRRSTPGRRHPLKSSYHLRTHRSVRGTWQTVGVVLQTPRFVDHASLLDNLRYGCENLSESVVWSVCRALGVGRHLTTSKAGQRPIGSIALSPIDRQLLAVARAILPQPDVLLVHNLGALEPASAERLGRIFNAYVSGCALTSLGRVAAATIGLGGGTASRGRSAVPSHVPHESTHESPPPVRRNTSEPTPRSRMASMDGSLHSERDSHANGSVNGSANSTGMADLRNVRFDVAVSDAKTVLSRSNTAMSIGGGEQSVRRRRGTGSSSFSKIRTTSGGEMEELSDHADRRTVIWHARMGVLRDARVARCLKYSEGRLVVLSESTDDRHDMEQPAVRTRQVQMGAAEAKTPQTRPIKMAPPATSSAPMDDEDEAESEQRALATLQRQRMDNSITAAEAAVAVASLFPEAKRAPAYQKASETPFDHDASFDPTAAAAASPRSPASGNLCRSSSAVLSLARSVRPSVEDPVRAPGAEQRTDRVSPGCALRGAAEGIRIEVPPAAEDSDLEF